MLFTCAWISNDRSNEMISAKFTVIIKKLDFHLLEHNKTLHLELGIYRQNPEKVRVVRIEYYGPSIELRLMGQFQQFEIGVSLYLPNIHYLLLKLDD
jgi:hypothetical protein